MIYGHRNDPEGFHRCLQEFDAQLPRAACRRCGPDDLLILVLRPRLRPDHRVDRPLARARAAAGPHRPAAAHGPAVHDGESRRRRRDRRHAAGDRAGCTTPSSAGARRDRRDGAVELIARKRDGGVPRTRRDPLASSTAVLDGERRGRAGGGAGCMAVVLPRAGPTRRSTRCADAMLALGRRASTCRRSAGGRRQALDGRRGRQGRRSRWRRWWRRAACRWPRCAGRGLGHTGGTLDKLESIPGHARRALVGGDAAAQVEQVGMGGSPAGRTELAPADAALSSLRDATGTSGLAADRGQHHVEEGRLRRVAGCCSTSRSGRAPAAGPGGARAGRR